MGKSAAMGCADFNPRTPCGVRLASSGAVYFATDDFNPRTPCGVRQAMDKLADEILGISIHAPRAGCDGEPVGEHFGSGRDFNPRTPCGVRRVDG